jgi:tetratricopeptide (TPR) repeat protein
LPALIDDVEDYYERCVLYAKYYRNMGLVKDHKDLIEDYLTGLSYIRKIRVAKDYDAIITRGTLNNNLGLAYLHSGHLEEAISAFESSHSTLHDLNYDEYTPLTNLSACFAMQNDYSKAYEYLLLAKSFPGKSKYREICIDVNLSLVYWKLNKKEEALELIKPILGIGGKSREIFDSEIQIRTYLNYGYFMMKEGKYAEAAAAFKKSMDFNFRISPDIQIKKRTLLMMYSLSKAGLLIGQDLGDISCVDLDETGGIPASRPYDYHTLAFYFS